MKVSKGKKVVIEMGQKEFEIFQANLEALDQHLFQDDVRLPGFIRWNFRCLNKAIAAMHAATKKGKKGKKKEKAA